MLKAMFFHLYAVGLTFTVAFTVITIYCLLSWKPIKMGNQRRLADYIAPDEIIDLTKDDVVEPGEEDEAAEGASGYQCPICFEGLESPVAPTCGHIFCVECLTLYLRRFDNCPLCKRVITEYIRLYF